MRIGSGGARIAAIYGGMESAIPGTMGAVKDAASSPTSSLTHRLERDRLEQRAVRVRQVIHALRERADSRDTAGGAPRPLRAAIEDFGRELAELERRLQRHR